MEEESPRTIRDLLAQHRRATGDSFAVIAQKTGLSKSLVGVLATSTASRKVHENTIDKLSAGLALPREVVAAAASETTSPTYPLIDPHERELMKLARDMTPYGRVALVSAARSILALERNIRKE